MIALIYEYPYVTISAVALLINIPLGAISERKRKFSLEWLLWVHASIPLIILMRLTLAMSPWYIPLCIVLAAAGQAIGSRWTRSRLLPQERARLQKAPVVKGLHG